MKKVLFIALMAIFAINASAQTDLKFSVNAGIGMSSYYGDGSDGSDAKFAYKVGVGMEMPFTNVWSLQTGLNLISKGAKGAVDNATDGKINALYLELPIMAGARVQTASGFDILFKAGPYVAYGVGGKTSVESSGVEVSVDTFRKDLIDKKFDAGLGFGVGFEFSKFVVGIDAHYGLTKVMSEGGISPKNTAAFLTFGYKF